MLSDVAVHSMLRGVDKPPAKELKLKCAKEHPLERAGVFIAFFLPRDIPNNFHQTRSKSRMSTIANTVQSVTHQAGENACRDLIWFQHRGGPEFRARSTRVVRLLPVSAIDIYMF